MGTQAPSQSALTLIVILSWYGSNIGVLLLNKHLLDGTSFKSPIFLTLCHMSACVLIGLVVSVSGFMPAKKIQSRSQLMKIAVLAVIFCSSIVLGNASLKYIPISFNQAIGSSTPFFTAVLAFFLEGQVESAWTYATLIPVVGGVVVASGGEPLFHHLGFIMCVLSTSGRGLKSVIQSMIMKDPSDKMDAMSLLLYMSTISCLLLLPLTVFWEPQTFGQVYQIYQADHGFALWLISNSSLAYFVNLTNFLVTKYTSALTLQVLGNAKGIVASFVSVMIFGNPVTLMGMAGYLITIAGVVLYSESKRRSKVKKHDSANEQTQGLLPISQGNQSS